MAVARHIELNSTNQNMIWTKSEKSTTHKISAHAQIARANQSTHTHAQNQNDFR